jgi:hypothetical protein
MHPGADIEEDDKKVLTVLTLPFSRSRRGSPQLRR